MRAIVCGIGVGVLAIAAFGQEFEVASIRPSGPLVPGSDVKLGVHIDGAQVRCNQMSLSDLIGMAYKVKHYQINGPDWIAGERFNVSAKLPDGASRDQVPEMMKTLLASRFQMKLHHDSKPYPVYALIVAKGGLKMKEVPPETSDSPEAEKNKPFEVGVSGGPRGVSLSLGRGSFFDFSNNRLQVKKISMIGLSDLLARFMDRPVVDMTGLTGLYDFGFDLAPEDYRSMMIRSAIAAGVQLPPEALRLLDGASDASLHAGLDSVGLKLDARKAPIDVLVVDQVQKTPTEN
jgi:uncharacterized protein (TIGR03435 family)